MVDKCFFHFHTAVELILIFSSCILIRGKTIGEAVRGIGQIAGYANRPICG